MMKKLGLIAIVLLAVWPAMAVPEGTTNQCWDFTQQTSRTGITPSEFFNPYGEPDGGPVSLIQGMGGKSVSWSDGTWVGEEFKIIIDIPNQPIANPYKQLWIDMRYLGEIAFAWVIDVDSGNQFELINEEEGQDGNWQTLSQEWRFAPNPREEIVVIGFKGSAAGVPAVLDKICVETLCVPEPATVGILGVSALVLGRRKKV
jgi:hypothetical protein